MDPQIIHPLPPPPAHRKEKQQPTAKTQKTIPTVPTVEEASKQPKSKFPKTKQKTGLPETTLEPSKGVISVNPEKQKGKGKKVYSKRNESKSKTGNQKPKSNQNKLNEVNNLVKVEFERENENDKRPLEQMKPPEYAPLHYDRKSITFIGKIGYEPVVTILRIFNTTRLPHLFKIKSSNNFLFKITPTLGLIDSLCDVHISITYGGTNAPPPYQDFITVHAMLTDPLNPSVYDTFKARSRYINRDKFLIDYAYHEDVEELLGNRPEDIYRLNWRHFSKWVKAVVYAGRRDEKEELLKEKLIVESPRRTVEKKRERQAKFFKDHFENLEWFNKMNPKPAAVKPIRNYKWRGASSKEKEEEKGNDKKSLKKSEEKKKEKKKEDAKETEKKEEDVQKVENKEEKLDDKIVENEKKDGENLEKENEK